MSIRTKNNDRFHRTDQLTEPGLTMTNKEAVDLHYPLSGKEYIVFHLVVLQGLFVRWKENPAQALGCWFLLRYLGNGSGEGIKNLL